MKFHSLRSEELIGGGGMVLGEGQLAPSSLVRMFRERYKPPPTTRSGAESQPLNDFAVL